MSLASSIYIYGCDSPPEYSLEELASYIKKIHPNAKLEKRDQFFSGLINQKGFDNLDGLAEEVTLCRVHNVSKELEEFSPLPLEIDYEKKRLTAKRQLKGIIYDGFCMQAVCSKAIEPQESTLDSCHIIFTNQLMATFDDNDKRYHLRVGIYGHPNIISTSGLVEAMAKPREYYLKEQMGINPAVLKEEFKEDIIAYEDSRITELLKGYVAQAIFYHATGEAFCQDKNCRLYNAHWQKDALAAQLKGKYEFCPQHAEFIHNWQNK